MGHLCVDFMDVIMGDIPYITTLCLNGTLPCVDFMDVIMGDTPYITTLCLNGTLPCVDSMHVTMGDTPYPDTIQRLPPTRVMGRPLFTYSTHLRRGRQLLDHWSVDVMSHLTIVFKGTDISRGLGAGRSLIVHEIEIIE